MMQQKNSLLDINIEVIIAKILAIAVNKYFT